MLSKELQEKYTPEVKERLKQISRIIDDYDKLMKKGDEFWLLLLVGQIHETNSASDLLTQVATAVRWFERCDDDNDKPSEIVFQIMDTAWKVWELEGWKLENGTKQEFPKWLINHPLHRSNQH